MQFEDDFMYDPENFDDPLWGATARALGLSVPIPADFVFRWVSFGHLLPVTYEVDAAGAARCCLNEGNDKLLRQAELAFQKRLTAEQLELPPETPSGSFRFRIFKPGDYGPVQEAIKYYVGELRGMGDRLPVTDAARIALTLIAHSVSLFCASELSDSVVEKIIPPGEYRIEQTASWNTSIPFYG